MLVIRSCASILLQCPLVLLFLSDCLECTNLVSPFIPINICKINERQPCPRS